MLQFKTRIKNVIVDPKKSDISMKLLMKFCDENMWGLEKPWTYKGMTYATNGHVLIRLDYIIDGIEEYSPGEVGTDMKKIENIFKDVMNKKSESLHAVIDIPKVKDIPKEKITYYNNSFFFGVCFNQRYLRIISKLPRPILRITKDKSNEFYFTFEGGDGVIMRIDSELKNDGTDNIVGEW